MNSNRLNFRLVIKLTFALLFLHLVPVNAQEVYKVNAQRLNMRATPSTNGRLLGTLTQGATVTVESIENGWALLNHEGKACYVSAKYLSKEEKQDSKEKEKAYQQEQKTTTKTVTMTAATVTEQSESRTSEKIHKRLVSGSVIYFGGEGEFLDKLSWCVGWHFVNLNDFGFEMVSRRINAKYSSTNLDFGPNYSYKLWENGKNRLYATAALCLSSRLQSVPDVTVTSTGKIKEDKKYKLFTDFVSPDFGDASPCSRVRLLV